MNNLKEKCKVCGGFSEFIGSTGKCWECSQHCWSCDYSFCDRPKDYFCGHCGAQIREKKGAIVSTQATYLTRYAQERRDFIAEIEERLDYEGVAEVAEGIYLNTQENILEEQREWHDDDPAKEREFSRHSFWIVTNNGVMAGFDSVADAVADVWA